jgi:hypothetical protein
MTQRIRNFCFTINNPEEEDERQLHKLNFKYLIYGVEFGKEETRHLQGYCVMNSGIRFETLKKQITRAHIEKRKGTHEQASNYCKKDGVFKEFGECKQGERTDLDNIREMCINETQPMKEITMVGNNQQINTAIKCLTYNEPVRNWKPEVIWYYGESGCGKTRRAYEETDPDKLYVKNESSKWWDGYDGHEHVIIDDFRGNWWDLPEMLSLLDRYRKQVEVKGGWRQFKPRKIIITSIRHPKYEYTFGKQEPSKQLIRRIDKIIELSARGNTSGTEENGTEVVGNTIPPLLSWE